MRLQSGDGCIFEVEPSAMRLSSLIQDMLECCDAPEEELVPLPAASGAMLAKVVDFCRAHGGVAPEAPEKPLPSADLAACGVSRHDCELLGIPAEGLFELLRVAEYLDMESLMSLTLAKLASLMIIEPPMKNGARGREEIRRVQMYAESLFARVRARLEAERSALARGCREGRTPSFVALDSLSAAEKLLRERGFLQSEHDDLIMMPMDEDRLVWRALEALWTSAQQWDDVLSGSAHVDFSQLLVRTLGHCFDPCFQGKILDMPRPLQRQIEHYFGSEMVALLSDARAVVKCFGLGTLAEDLGAQLGRALDAWQAEVQTLHLMPRVTLEIDDKGDWLTKFVQSLELHADRTFVHTSYSREFFFVGEGPPCYEGRASVEVGTWSIHRGSERLEQGDQPFNGKTSSLFEGSLILEGTAHAMAATNSLELEMGGVFEEAVKRVISCGELLAWAEGSTTAKQTFYLPTFAGALEDCFHRASFKQIIHAELEKHLEDLRRFFRDMGMKCCSAAAISCRAEPAVQHGARREQEAVMDTVVMEVVHDEEPAAIDPMEAEEASSQLWASGVERMNGGAVAPEQRSVDVAVMQFSRDPGAFDGLLLDSPLARRAAEAGIQVQPSWANGAKVFVKEISPEVLEEAHVELRPRHVVVYLPDVQEVLDVLAALPSTTRPRLKPAAPLVVVPGADSTSLFGELTSSSAAQSSLAPHDPDQVTESDGNVASGGSGCSSAAPRPALATSTLPPGLKVKFTFLCYEEEEANREVPRTSRSV